MKKEGSFLNIAAAGYNPMRSREQVPKEWSGKENKKAGYVAGGIKKGKEEKEEVRNDEGRVWSPTDSKEPEILVQM